MTGNCTVCGKHGTITRGYCAKHYARWHRHGNPNTVLPKGRPVINGTKPPFELRPATQHAATVPAQRAPLETVVTVCHTPGCGQPAGRSSRPLGWIRTQVSGSHDPARWWCCARCAYVGIARAELRFDGIPEGADQ